VPGGHERPAGEGLDIERLGELAVDSVAHTAQLSEVEEALLGGILRPGGRGWHLRIVRSRFGGRQQAGLVTVEWGLRFRGVAEHRFTVAQDAFDRDVA
jgi:hypothetical protein